MSPRNNPLVQRTLSHICALRRGISVTKPRRRSTWWSYHHLVDIGIRPTRHKMEPRCFPCSIQVREQAMAAKADRRIRWGSGKSSLTAMARRGLEQDSSFVCVSFSPWQHEDYDDVKAALMATVLKDLLENAEHL